MKTRIFIILMVLSLFACQDKKVVTVKKLDEIQIDKECKLIISDSLGLKIFKLESQYSKYFIGFSNVDYVKTIKNKNIYIIENSINGSTFGAKKDLIVWNNGVEWNFFLNPVVVPTYQLNFKNQVKDETSGINYSFESGSLIPVMFTLLKTKK